MDHGTRPRTGEFCNEIVAFSQARAFRGGARGGQTQRAEHGVPTYLIAAEEYGHVMLRLPAPRWVGEQDAAITNWSLADLAESAGNELTRRIRIPCNIVDVHRLNDSCTRIYPSLRYGVFLLLTRRSKASSRNSPGSQSSPWFKPLSVRLSPLSPVQSVTRTQTPCMPPAQTGAVLRQEDVPAPHRPGIGWTSSQGPAAYPPLWWAVNSGQLN